MPCSFSVSRDKMRTCCVKVLGRKMKGCFPIVISIVYTDYVAVSKSAFQNVQLSFGRTTEHQVVAILS